MPSTLSSFYIVQHTFKLDAGLDWWTAHQAAAEVWQTRQSKQEELGFHCHSFVPISAVGPIYCVWEVKPNIPASEFQAFLDGEHALGMGMMNNSASLVELSLTGAPPYPRHFVPPATTPGRVSITFEEQAWFQGQINAQVGEDAAVALAEGAPPFQSPSKMPTGEEQEWLERQISEIREADAWLEQQAVEAAIKEAAQEAQKAATMAANAASAAQKAASAASAATAAQKLAAVKIGKDQAGQTEAN
uniref:Uncharacterized protein n=1 Tax=Coccolithus braarudii TaxID=221442 RepID=A0A7S0LC12_9EUKA